LMKLVFVILVPFCWLGFTVDEQRNYLENELFPVVNRSFCRPQSRFLLAIGGQLEEECGVSWARILTYLSRPPDKSGQEICARRAAPLQAGSPME